MSFITFVILSILFGIIAIALLYLFDIKDKEGNPVIVQIPNVYLMRNGLFVWPKYFVLSKNVHSIPGGG